MSDVSGLGPDRLKHLDFIQAVVTRLGNSSFLIKGWTLTIAAAFFAVVTSRQSWQIAVIGVVPLVGFWFLDGVFLRTERMFRRLYDDARLADTRVELLSMDVSPYRASTTWAAAAFSRTLLIFYGALVLVDVGLVLTTVVQRP